MSGCLFIPLAAFRIMYVLHILMNLFPWLDPGGVFGRCALRHSPIPTCTLQIVKR
ncbi:hypothetical protein B0H12DRAFT_1106916 [Mycena haematopus]|nr:hypothetical protein B0H12DRAFT_1106916 [Mycena haematopus]